MRLTYYCTLANMGVIEVLNCSDWECQSCTMLVGRLQKCHHVSPSVNPELRTVSQLALFLETGVSREFPKLLETARSSQIICHTTTEWPVTGHVNNLETERPHLFIIRAWTLTHLYYSTVTQCLLLISKTKQQPPITLLLHLPFLSQTFSVAVSYFR